MSRVVVIHQPDFAPYLGFLHRFLKADLYIALDHVQFVQHTSRAWTHRDKIKTPRGERWLTLSVQKTPRETPIDAVELSTTRDWRRENLDLIRENYRTASGFAEIFPWIEQLYSFSTNRLADFNLSVIAALMDAFDVRIPTVRSSTLSPAGRKNELLVDLLVKVGASVYISGVGARAYLDETRFRDAGIEVRWQDFEHPAYPQLHGAFIPFLSSFDVLLNCGIEGSRALLRGLR